MLSHANIWKAIDRLAQNHGLSTSALARKSGLDPTSFNVSKRTASDNRERWPSTESIAKVLKATGSSLDEFILLVTNHSDVKPYFKDSIHIQMSDKHNSMSNFVEPMQPGLKNGWDNISFPGKVESDAFAFTVSGQDLLPYKEGDILIVSFKAELNCGNRILLKKQDGAVLLREFAQQTTQQIEFQGNLSEYDKTLLRKDIMWAARILWASQ